MSGLVDIAAAIVTAWSGGFTASPQTIGQNIAVSRIYVTRPKLDALIPFNSASPAASAIQVFVKPIDEQLVDDEATRGMLIYNYHIGIGIAAKPSSLATTNDVDALHELREQLKDYWFQQGSDYALPGLEQGCIGIETVSDGDDTSLREKGLFLAEFILTFEGGRSRDNP